MIIIKLALTQVAGVISFFVVTLIFLMMSPSDEPEVNLGIVVLAIATFVSGYMASLTYGLNSFIPIILLTLVLLVICFLPWFTDQDITETTPIQKSIMVILVLIMPLLGSMLYKRLHL